MKKLFFTFLLSIFTIGAASAHEDENSSKNPSEPLAVTQDSSQNKLPILKKHPESLDIEWPNYGSLIIDGGFNFLRNCPQAMKAKDISATSFSLSAYYNIRFGKSHFTISPGLGMGFDGYQLKGPNTLVRSENANRYTEFEDAKNILRNSTKILSSSLNAKYWDLLLEFRFNADNKYPKESFFVALGGKFGMLWGASSTIKYREDRENKESVIYESFNLENIRYGLHARLGWDRFSIFYAHTFSSLFKKNKGPHETSTKPSTVGLSIDLF